jgi:hypothetical protein
MPTSRSEVKRSRIAFNSPLAFSAMRTSSTSTGPQGVGERATFVKIASLAHQFQFRAPLQELLDGAAHNFRIVRQKNLNRHEHLKPAPPAG